MAGGRTLFERRRELGKGNLRRGLLGDAKFVNNELDIIDLLDEKGITDYIRANCPLFKGLELKHKTLGERRCLLKFFLSALRFISIRSTEIDFSQPALFEEKLIEILGTTLGGMK